MREGRREWECDLRDDGSRWEPTHITKHCPRISPYKYYIAISGSIVIIVLM